MSYHNQSSSRFPRGSTGQKHASPMVQLDLYSILEIDNPVCGYFTCSGYAPSKHRRCQWTLYGNDVRDRLQVYSNRVPFVAPTLAELRSIATLALCKEYHRKQADEVARKWKSIIDQAEMDELARLMREANLGGGSDWSQAQSEERKAKEEKERKQREQREREEAEARAKREQQAREEAQREKERQERERAEQSAKSWREAWEKYTNGFDQFKARKSRSIPWPVKSGLHCDVSEINVVTFYRLAVSGSSLRQRIKVMDRECLRWHPDKMKHLISHIQLSEQEKANLSMVARKVIEVRKEFQDTNNL